MPGLVGLKVSRGRSVVNTGLAGHEDVDWNRTEPHIQANRRAVQQIDSLNYVHSVYPLQRFTPKLVAGRRSEFDVWLTPTMTIPPPTGA